MKNKVNYESNFVKRAMDHQWKEVLSLLRGGQIRPRVERFSDGSNCISALSCALEDGEFEIAKELYDFGDRLDDYIGDSNSLLDFFLAAHMHGDDYFYNENATLSMCCHTGSFEQAECLMPTASQQELDDALLEIVGNINRHPKNPAVNVLFFRKLIGSGANSAAHREELRTTLDAMSKYPEVMRPDEDAVETLLELVDGVI